jgi:hypothetical protein
MKLQNNKSNKNILPNESLYNITLRDCDGSREYLNDLNKFLQIDKKENKKTLSFNKSKYIEEADQFSKTLYYVPKKKVNFVPVNLLSYGNSSSNLPYKKIKNDSSNSKFFSDNESNTVYFNHGYNKKNIDLEYMNFKTNFILKFSKNINKYDKLFSYADYVSDNSKKSVTEGIKMLKNYSEKKDRILFDNMELSDKNLYNWKENIIYIFEIETLWQKITDIILRELKNTRELMLVLSKKNKELTEENKKLSDDVYKLNEFIRVNDIYNKADTVKKKIRHFYDLKQDFERKENMGMMNIHRLENE